MSTELKILLDEMRTTMFGPTPAGCCVKCKQPFSDANVHTSAGWRETKLSLMCEDCWDAAMKPLEDDDE